MKRTDLTMGAKVLYAFLRDSAGRKDHCWPSQRYLANSLKQTVRSVQNHLKRLSELGLVAIKKRPWRGNVYYILEQQAAAPSPAKASAPTAPALSSRPAETPSRQSSSTPTYNRQKADAVFVRLWDAYPRAEARRRALRFWHRLSRAGTAPTEEFLLAKIKENQEHNPRWKRGYAPFFATWLQDRRWEDPLPLEKPLPVTESVPEQAKPFVLQKEEPKAAMPIAQLPETANKRLQEALSLWPHSVSEAQVGMVKTIWGILHRYNRIPAKETILAAAKIHIRFSEWLNAFYFKEACWG